MIDINTYIEKASANEATPALVNFWQKQYSTTFGSKVRYDEAVQARYGVGYINLTSLLTVDKKDIDHQALQAAIAILVRFLDSLVTEPNYRSIHLSVENFSEFLSITDTPTQIGVDYIGSLIADFAYRASENLAHEKGAFTLFDTIPKHIRAVEFEMWVDASGSYKNAKELSTMFDDTSIQSTTWKLVPRRNLAILDFPQDQTYWHNWSDDFAEPSAKKSILVNSGDILNNISEQISQEDLSSSNQFFSDDFEFQPSNNQTNNTANDFEVTKEGIPQSLSNDTAQNTTENILQTPQENTQQTLETILADIPPTPSAIPFFDQNLTGEMESLQPTSENPSDLMASPTQENINIKEELKNTTDNKKEPALIPGKDYTLTKSAALLLNTDNQILLFQFHTSSPDVWTLPNTNIKLNEIPEESIIKYFQEYTHIPTKILDEVGSVMNATNPAHPDSENIIYNIFLLQSEENIQNALSDFTDLGVTNYQYFDFDKLPATDILAKVAIDKYKRRQKIIADAVTTNLEKELQIKLEERLAEISKEEQNQKQIELEQANHENKEINDQIHDQAWEPEPTPLLNPMNIDHINQIEAQPIPAPFEEPLKEVGQYEPNIPGRFRVKLDTLLKSDDFGDLNLVLEYSATGITSVKLSSKSPDFNTNPDLEDVLNLILHLFNHLLSQGLSLKDLLKDLDMSTDSDNGQLIYNSPVKKILSLILDAIQHAPATINDLKNEMLS